MKTKLPTEVLEQMNRENWASLEQQKQYWIDKEAEADNATSETCEALIAALEDIELRCTQDRIASGIGKLKNQPLFLLGALERIADLARTAIDASNLSKPEATTANPKPKTSDNLSRTESLTDWYDHRETPYRLRDEGRNPDGSGESYAERNL